MKIRYKINTTKNEIGIGALDHECSVRKIPNIDKRENRDNFTKLEKRKGKALDTPLIKFSSNRSCRVRTFFEKSFKLKFNQRSQTGFNTKTDNKLRNIEDWNPRIGFQNF